MLFSILLPTLALAGHLHPEKWYQEKWCQGKGQVEVVLPDKTRCDCLTSTHAVEVDFGNHWYQGVGQALYYSMQTGRRAGILLIIEKESDYKYWIRLNSTIEHFDLPITAWKISP
jgi:hypothetical protein